MNRRQIMEEQIRELTLILLYLTSWEDKDLPMEMRRSRKGYPFEVLNELTAADLLRGSVRSKSVYLTEEGVKEASKISRKILENSKKKIRGEFRLRLKIDNVGAYKTCLSNVQRNY